MKTLAITDLTSQHTAHDQRRRTECSGVSLVVDISLYISQSCQCRYNGRDVFTKPVSLPAGGDAQPERRSDDASIHVKSSASEFRGQCGRIMRVRVHLRRPNNSV